jgi:hypothetical protein
MAKSGWKKESARHSLAKNGVKTSRLYNDIVNPVKPSKKYNYYAMMKKIVKQYPDEQGKTDYYLDLKIDKETLDAGTTKFLWGVRPDAMGTELMSLEPEHYGDKYKPALDRIITPGRLAKVYYCDDGLMKEITPKDAELIATNFYSKLVNEQQKRRWGY